MGARRARGMALLTIFMDGEIHQDPGPFFGVDAVGGLPGVRKSALLFSSFTRASLLNGQTLDTWNDKFDAPREYLLRHEDWYSKQLLLILQPDVTKSPSQTRARRHALSAHPRRRRGTMFGVPLPPWFSVRLAHRPSTHGLVTGPVGEPHRLRAEVLPSSFGAQRLVGRGLRTL